MAEDLQGTVAAADLSERGHLRGGAGLPAALGARGAVPGAGARARSADRRAGHAAISTTCRSATSSCSTARVHSRCTSSNTCTAKAATAARRMVDLHEALRAARLRSSRPTNCPTSCRCSWSSCRRGRWRRPRRCCASRCTSSPRCVSGCRSAGAPMRRVLRALLQSPGAQADGEAVDALRSREDDPDDLEALDRVWEEEPVTFGPRPEPAACGTARSLDAACSAAHRPPHARPARERRSEWPSSTPCSLASIPMSPWPCSPWARSFATTASPIPGAPAPASCCAASQLMWGSVLFHVGVLIIFFGHLVGLLTPICDLRAARHRPRLQADAGDGRGRHRRRLRLAGALHAGPSPPVRSAHPPHLQLRRYRDPAAAEAAARAGAGDHRGIRTTPRRARDGRASWPGRRASSASIGMRRPTSRSADWIFKLHIFLGLTIFLVFPFTRLVHMLSAPVRYLWRPGYQIVRTRRRAGA